MVSDSEIVSRLREFLETSDLTKTTTTILRRRLEEDLGIDLSEKRDFIRVQIDLFLQSKEEEQQEEVQQEEEETQEKEVKEEGEDEQEEEEEEEEDEEEEINGKGSKKRGSSKLKTEVKKRGGGGFCKLCCLSPQLQEFTGVPEMARTEVVKQIWAYIKEKDLQEPSNRRKIRCDEKLHSLFKVDIIDMFQMNKALAKHIWPLGSDDTVPSKSISKEKQPKQETEEDEEEPKRKGKKQKGKEPKGRGGTSGILCPLQLSDALVKFFGTVDSALPRSEVVKRIWDYIKENNLQDPADRRRIICDEKLKELFNVDTFNGFTVSKLLTTHLTKINQ